MVQITDVRQPALPAVANLPSFTSSPGFGRASLDQLNGGQPSLIGGALSAGTHELGSQFGGFVSALGTTLGARGIADWGQQVAQSQALAAEQTGRPDLEADPWSLSGMAYGLTKGLPTLAGAAIAHRLGAKRLAPALGVSEGVGGTLGAGAALYPGMVGGNVETARKANGGELTPNAAAASLALGIPEAAVGSIVPGNVEKMLARGMTGNALSRFGQGAAINAGMGGVQGAANTVFNQFMGDPSRPVVDRANDVVQAALQGAVQGGVIGGVFGVVGGRKRVAPTAPDADLTAAATVPDAASEDAKTIVGPADASGAAQVGLDLPEQRTPQMADQPPAPEMQGPTIPPELVNGRQMRGIVDLLLVP